MRPFTDYNPSTCLFSFGACRVKKKGLNLSQQITAYTPYSLHPLPLYNIRKGQLMCDQGHQIGVADSSKDKPCQPILSPYSNMSIFTLTEFDLKLKSVTLHNVSSSTVMIGISTYV